jgi:ATP-dependent DNA helicase RecQ
MDIDQRIRDTARDTFGWEQLRPGQLPAMRAVVSGHDTLAVMPTGSGKSACYQVPGLLLPGPTVVVSPLIALQHDQVAALGQPGKPTGAVSVNSSNGQAERRSAFRAVRQGEIEYFFVSPEQLGRDDVTDALAAARPSLFVVDEAHCISAWGHDFRPDYLRLHRVIERLGRPTVLALTATASPPVREEIVARLGLREPVQVVTGFDRPNLWLSVLRFESETDKRDAAITQTMTASKPALVYAATRNDTEAYAADLAELGVRAAAYHAGMRRGERDDVQAAFMADELDVVVATTAFGLGVDKPNVRCVLHADVADSLDSYYHEIGRAGRDGEPSTALLLYRPADLGLRRFFASGTRPRAEDLAAVLEIVHRDGETEMARLRAQTRLPPKRLTALVNLLQAAGALVTGERGQLLPNDVDGAVEAAHAVAEARQRVESQESK